jgi:hypothetical protein
MRSLTSTNSRPYRHFGGVALHNRALRIIGEAADNLVWVSLIGDPISVGLGVAVALSPPAGAVQKVC